MKNAQNVRPISFLKEKTGQLLKNLAATGSPVFLTMNGEPRAVIQDATSYQELLEAKERLDAILKVRQGIRDLKAGRKESAEKVFARLEKKHGLSN